MTQNNDTVLHNDDIISTVCQFCGLSEISSVARVNKKWKKCLEYVEEDVYESVAKKYHPRLLELMNLMPVGSCSWKVLLKRRLESTSKAGGKNQQLQNDMKTMFRHEGILTKVVCYVHNQVIPYYDLGKNFQPREKGFTVLNLIVDDHHAIIRGSYDDHKFLMENWESERQLLTRFCGVLGYHAEDYDILETPFLERDRIWNQICEHGEFKIISRTKEHEQEVPLCPCERNNTA